MIWIGKTRRAIAEGVRDAGETMTNVETAHAFLFPGRCATARRGRWLPFADIRSRFGVLRAAIAGLAEMVAGTATASQPMREARTTADSGAMSQRFHQTIVPHLDSAYNFARFLSRDADVAQDIVQDAFLRAFRSFDGFRGGDPRAWLFSIVRNCYYAWLTQRRRRAGLEVPLHDRQDDPDAPSAADEIASEDDSAETTLIRDAEARQVRQVINTLPDAMREVLVLRELEDLSYRQIADIIDAPIGTVMSRLARARHDFGEAWLAAEKCRVAE
jgi:RNA polymerase sigma factor (sigma-70 family)